MKYLNQIKLNINHSERELLEKICKNLHIDKSKLTMDRVKILKKSIDARDKKNILFVYNVVIDYDEKNDNKKFNAKITLNNNVKDIRPIIVGFGPAGIFAAYIFVLNGIKPIILERGKNIEDRKKDVEKFFDTMILNEESNVSFGEGGAGAFSDGKLNTNNKDHFGIHRFILETFVKFGAPINITYDNNPHIGTDRLIDVIKNMRNYILSLGAEIRYNTKYVYNDYKSYATDGTPILLAIGNSSRDTFRDLYDNGFNIEAKPFAIGYRIAHRQKMIDIVQYGKSIEKLGSASYKLTYDANDGRGVYSFCMCPGGYIINSSNYKGYLSINGMSYNDRKGLYANSAIVETIKPSDIDRFSDFMSMVDFVEKIEKKAFSIENGYIPYQILFGNSDNVDASKVFKGKAKETKNLLSIYENIGLSFDLNHDIKNALMHFNKIIPSFYGENDSEVILAGAETRTSSIALLKRDENFMCHMKNYYPCGEGLGHGGGIMSAAADGVMVAINIIKGNYS